MEFKRCNMILRNLLEFNEFIYESDQSTKW